MACKPVNLTVEEIKNYIKNKSNIYNSEYDQTAEQSLIFLKHTTDSFTQVEDPTEKDKPKYGFSATREVAVRNRVTDAVNKKFLRAKGKTEVERINAIPDNQIKSAAGTHIHEIAQHLTNLIVYKVGDINNIKKQAITGPNGMMPSDFDNLRSGVENIVKQIKATQAEINKRNGTEGEVTILTEQVVIDPTKDMGGSIDILAVYSDNTASIFDFKAMNPNTLYKKGTGKNAKIISEEWIPFYKEESFRIQQTEYKRVLQDLYGIKNVRQTRIVPIHVEYKLKSKEERKDGSFYTGKIAKLAIGEKQGEHLEQLPVGIELTGFAGIDSLIRNNLNIIEKAKRKQNQKGLKKGEWSFIQEKITRLRKATNELILKSDFNEYYQSITAIMKDFEARRDEPEFNEDGSPNFKYLSSEELDELKGEFEVYATIVENANKYIEYIRKEDPAKYIKLSGMIYSNHGLIQRTITNMNEKISERILDTIDDKFKDENGNLIPTKPEGLLNTIYNRTSEFANPIFKKFKSLVDKALNKKRISLSKIKEEISTKQDALYQWAKDRGVSRETAFGYLINKDTGNMHSHLTKEFWEKHKALFENKNIEGIKEIYEFKDKDAWREVYEERLEQMKSRLKTRYHDLQDYEDETGDVLKTAKQNKLGYERDLKKWKKANNLVTSSDAWYNERNRYFLKFKEGVQEKNYSEEYKFILENKPLKEFYDMFSKYTTEFRDSLGLSYSKMPNNFIPNIRKDAMERLVSNSDGNIFSKFSLSNSIQEMVDSLQVREEDAYIADRDLNTGEIQRSIPVLFTNPFRDADGKVIKNAKSYDLGRVLYLFANMAYNHKYMSEIESNVTGLKHVLANTPEKAEDTAGKWMKNIIGEKATTFLGKQADIYKAFEKHSDYYLYGIKFSEKGKTVNVMGKQVNSTKALLAAKQYFSAKTLGFAVIPGTAAWIHGRTGIYLESMKGIAFNAEQMKDTHVKFATEKSKYTAMTKFFDTHVEDKVVRDALELSGEALVKYVNSRVLYAPLRRADENIDNFILVAMSQNYGFDAQGNMRRLANLPEGSKSIWDLTTYDKEKGKLTVEGVNEDNFIAFRNAAKEIGVKIKGAMSNEDVNMADLNLYINMMMQFKTWMPGVLTERFGSLKYNEVIDAVDYGRYRAIASEFEYFEGEGFKHYLKESVLPNLANLIGDLMTFGLGPKMGLKRVNEGRAKKAYEIWKLENPVESQDISFKQFLDIKQRQIRAAIVETRVVLMMIGMISFLGAEGDDGRPTYNQTYLARKFYQILNRAESEIAFAMTPTEFIRLTQNPLPMMRLLSDMYKTIGNTLDETRDFVFGENDPRDRTPAGYYSTMWIHGVAQFRKLIEMYEEDKKNKY